jgi:lysophospholipase L1-like esterase
MNRAFGDSLTASGLQASSPSLAYLPRLSAALGITFQNQAIDGGLSGDMSRVAHNISQGADDKCIVQLGTNEVHAWLGDATKQGYYKALMMNIITQMACPVRKRAFTEMTLTGGWGSTHQYDADAQYAYGVRSYFMGDKIAAQVTGTAVYVTVNKRDLFAGQQPNGIAKVVIDGIEVGSVNSNGSGIGNARYNISPCTYRFVPAATSGNVHNVEIEITSNVQSLSGLFYVEGIASNQQAVKPHVFVGTVPRYTSAGYTAIGGSDAIVAQYNAILASIVSDLTADGLNVHLVDTNLNPATDLYTDGYHPNDAGHLKMKDAYAVAFGLPPPDPDPEPEPEYFPALVKFKDGSFYAQNEDGSVLKKIITEA